MASTLSLKNLQAAALQAGSTNNNNTTIDRRRFVGPDSSTPFLDFPSTSTTQPLAKTTDRADGRANHDSRPICIKVGVIAQANGSCYIESGNSKVICAVYGPKPRLSQPNFPSVTPLAITLRFAPFCMAAGRMIPTALGGIETTVSQLTHQALMPSLLPMSESSIVEVHITVLEWDGPLSPGPCVLASSVALASAGIPTLGLVILLHSRSLESSIFLIRHQLKPNLPQQSLTWLLFLPWAPLLMSAFAQPPIGNQHQSNSIRLITASRHVNLMLNSYMVLLLRHFKNISLLIHNHNKILSHLISFSN
ncbi:hypothetical protein KEM48_002510 [Puccinia striiformis f. sp. tritici PST-130]|nr:hypothetical protein KEM48_002510 [Puccinia striiformis f. sp. tritici PST-130]